MIEFTSTGRAIVRFKIENSSDSRRKEVKMTLDAYLALVKVSSSLEELRANVFEYQVGGPGDGGRGGVRVNGVAGGNGKVGKSEIGKSGIGKVDGKDADGKVTAA